MNNKDGKELMFYLPVESGTDKFIFVHLHLSKASNKRFFIFLNPILDESKRSHKFQAITARELCKTGNNVLRFDYYGTGDSFGEHFELDFSFIEKCITSIIDYIKHTYSIEEIILMGIRIGADIAINYANSHEKIRKIVLIEPIIEGSRYLLEQKIRRTSFIQLNNLTKYKEFVTINNELFEDFQGFPMSQNAIIFLNNLSLKNISLKKKEILLFKLNSILSKNNINNFIEKVKAENNLILKKIDCSEFWSSLEPIDISILSSEILKHFE